MSVHKAGFSKYSHIVICILCSYSLILCVFVITYISDLMFILIGT